MNGFTGNSAGASAEYRRSARRIRASFTGNSFLTQRALGDLARKRNRELQARHSPPAKMGPRVGIKPIVHPLQLQITAVVERGFSEHAASRMQPFGFTFSDRVALLDAGEKLGIPRFRANLILAMQENQAPARRSVVIPSAVVIPSVPAKGFAPPLLLILGIEILVVCALVCLILR